MTTRVRVALIYGGTSGEHSVSCLTAASVMRAMDPNKYEVLPIGIRKDGTWVPGTVNPEELADRPVRTVKYPSLPTVW